MPAYNSAEFIAESIHSVQNQTFENWELIVVDDGSIDETAGIVKKIKSEDFRIHYLYQDNKKQASARNNGIRIAKGLWIAFLDSDDLWIDTKLQIQFEVIVKENFDVVYSAGNYLYENGDTAIYDTINGIMVGNDLFKKLYIQNFIPILSVVVRKSVIDEVGLQKEEIYYHGCEDWDYLLRLSKANKKFIGLSERLFLYRKHSQGTSANVTKMRLAQAFVQIGNFDLQISGKDYIVHEIKPTVDSIALTLIENLKMNETKALYNHMFKSLNYKWVLVNLFILKVFGRYSLIPIRIWNRLMSVFLKFSFNS